MAAWAAIAMCACSNNKSGATSGSGGADGGGTPSSGSGAGGAGAGGQAQGGGGAGGAAVVPLPPPPEWMATSHALVKLRPGDALPASKEARLEAAKNEFEPVQIAFSGGENGHRIEAVALSDLTGPDGARIPAGRWVVHRVELFDVPAPSAAGGIAGPTPDPLIPDVDPFYGEKRNAFPLEVPAGELRAAWLEILVPEDAAPGSYQGQARVTTDEGEFGVPITLRVRDFALPSTASLPSAFGGFLAQHCAAHHGSSQSCGEVVGGSYDEGVEHYKTLYARALLDHRVTMMNVLHQGPPSGGQQDFDHFDAVYGPLLEGTAPTLLSGARMTTFRLRTEQTTWVAAWRQHFQQKGWSTTLFDYTCDEPPGGCPWSEITSSAPAIQAGGVRTLVTTSLSRAQSNGVLDLIDILVPLIGGTGKVTPGSAYQQWLDGDPIRQLWWYQSCESHGCGSGCGDGSQNEGYPPSYVIDALPMQARAMEWLTFTHNIEGELYWQTTYQLSTAWEDQCDFDGAGDGTLFYPGTPARIGGQRHIPVASVRLKLIREGMEDYEYLHLLEQLGDEAYAKQVAEGLFDDRSDVRADAADLYAARTQLADRIEALLAD